MHVKETICRSWVDEIRQQCTCGESEEGADNYSSPAVLIVRQRACHLHVCTRSVVRMTVGQPVVVSDSLPTRYRCIR